MSQICVIAIKTGKNRARATTCQRGGCPADAGRALESGWTNPGAVARLVAAGPLWSVGADDAPIWSRGPRAGGPFDIDTRPEAMTWQKRLLTASWIYLFDPADESWSAAMGPACSDVDDKIEAFEKAGLRGWRPVREAIEADETA